jgi:hypothetical protein
VNAISGFMNTGCIEVLARRTRRTQRHRNESFSLCP